MSVDHGDTAAGQDDIQGTPPFRLARRGYDRAEVDAYIADPECGFVFTGTVLITSCEVVSITATLLSF